MGEGATGSLRCEPAAGVKNNRRQDGWGLLCSFASWTAGRSITENACRVGSF